MRHAYLEQLFTLAGGFVRADGGLCATIPGTYFPAKMGRRYQGPVHTVGDVSGIELSLNALSRAPQASIPCLWIFECASKEEVGF